jgi:hypothetical protein
LRRRIAAEGMEQQHFQEGMAAFSAPLHLAVLVSNTTW